MISLSIIVPVYNVEQYLKRCIDSLLCQDMPTEEYEIILIDDGSTDNSSIIVDSYERTFGNIRAIHQSNQGLSGARNAGIIASRGLYLQFVDSDDYLEPNVLGGLLNTIRAKDLDVLRFNYQNVNENYQVFEPNKQSRPYTDYSNSVCSGRDFLENKLGYACYACQFIIRRDLLSDCFFREGIYYEDVEWTPRMLWRADRVSSTELVCYNYLIRQGSITRRNDCERKHKAITDKIDIISLFRDQMKGRASISWYRCMISNITLGILTTVSIDFYSERFEIIEKLKNMAVFPLTLRNSTRTGIRKKIIINISPALYCWLIKSARKS